MQGLVPVTPVTRESWAWRSAPGAPAGRLRQGHQDMARASLSKRETQREFLLLREAPDIAPHHLPQECTCMVTWIVLKAIDKNYKMVSCWFGLGFAIKQVVQIF